MSIAQSLLGEWDHEVESTKKMLLMVPDAKADWKPHAKSMTMGRLASHVAELTGWATTTIQQDELDLNPPGGAPWKPTVFTSALDNVALFDKLQEAGRAAIAGASDADFMKPWTLKNGGQVYFTMPKIAVMRSFVFNHIVHHRAQLSVYLRLNDISVPGMYGPSADESM